jgi:NAD(P)-dependent dehydrogenase (short-subunit alcohol dehydrogenase family)
LPSSTFGTVNNAAISVMAPVDAPGLDIAALDRQHAVNYTGVVPASAKRSSTWAMAGGSSTSALASAPASEARGWRTTRRARRRWPAYTRGITVNILQAGLIDTEMNPADSEFAPAFSATTALGRDARPDEVAAGVAFLARPDTTYVIGTVLDVDGGYSA